MTAPREVDGIRARPFPIQQGQSISWAAAEKAYVTYAKLFGRQQSLERLAERSGFGVQEWACLYLGHEPDRDTPAHHGAACIQRAVRDSVLLEALLAAPRATTEEGK